MTPLDKALREKYESLAKENEKLKGENALLLVKYNKLQREHFSLLTRYKALEDAMEYYANPN